MTDGAQFEGLLAEAMTQEFSGWDFSFMDGRWRESPLTWDYRTMILDRFRRAASLLDMGTGGGEFLASLPLPLLPADISLDFSRRLSRPLLGTRSGPLTR